MAKAMHCRDMGMDCGYTAKGESEQEVMEQAEQHARSEHRMNQVSPEMRNRMRGAIHEESTSCAACCG